MSTIREEITNAQRLNEIRRKMTSNILDNIQKLHFMLNLEDMSAINKEFSDVWNSNDIDKLREFNEKLNVLVEVYDIRKEREKMALFAIADLHFAFSVDKPWIFLGRTGRITVKNHRKLEEVYHRRRYRSSAGRPFLGMRD